MMCKMPTIDEYIEQIEEDVKISELNVKDRQMMLPALKHKYAGLLIRAKVDLSKMYGKRKGLLIQIAEKLKEKSPYELSDANAEKMAQGHEDIKAYAEKISMKKLEIELFEKAERIFSSMTFDIKNLVEIMKLEIE